MLNGDVFVFDNVVHMYDLSDDNLKRNRIALSIVSGISRSVT
jgi:hypothetical protein